jgi:transposase
VRLLWVGQDRTLKTMLRFFRWFGKDRSAALRYVCSDMWKPYLRVIAKKAAQALHVLDRFHIMAKMNKAIDEVRAQETKAMKAKGLEPVLHNSRWCLLKCVFRRSRSPIPDQADHRFRASRSPIPDQADHLHDDAGVLYFSAFLALVKLSAPPPRSARSMPTMWCMGTSNRPT